MVKKYIRANSQINATANPAPRSSTQRAQPQRPVNTISSLPSARWSGQCAGMHLGFFDHTGSTRSPAETRRRSSATTYQRMTLRNSIARVSTASFSTPKKLCAANGSQAPLNGSMPPSIQSSCLADAFTDFAKAYACAHLGRRICALVKRRASAQWHPVRETGAAP